MGKDNQGPNTAPDTSAQVAVSAYQEQVAELEIDLASKSAHLEAKEGEVEALNELVRSQATELLTLRAAAAAAEAQRPETAPPTPKQEFKVGQQTYKFKVPKYIGDDGQLKTAQQALQEPAELERLVLIRSGIIKLVS